MKNNAKPPIQTHTVLLTSLWLLGLLWAAPTQAARPLVSDDARLTNAHQCQMEVWSRLYQGGQEVWALPACNLGENLEVSLGGGRYENHEANYVTEDWVLQIKTLFKPLTTNHWGWGLAVGRVMHPDIQPGPNQLGNQYLNVPFSFSWLDDQLIIHLNAGWLRDRQQGQHKATYGLGSEFKVSPCMLGIAEIFGDLQQNPYAQIGLRYSLIPNLLQIDSTIGQQLEGSSQNQWLSIGVRWTP